MTAVRQPEHGAATAHIANLLREAIVRGDFAPGERVRQEQIADSAGGAGRRCGRRCACWPPKVS